MLNENGNGICLWRHAIDQWGRILTQHLKPVWVNLTWLDLTGLGTIIERRLKWMNCKLQQWSWQVTDVEHSHECTQRIAKQRHWNSAQRSGVTSVNWNCNCSWACVTIHFTHIVMVPCLAAEFGTARCGRTLGQQNKHFDPSEPTDFRCLHPQRIQGSLSSEHLFHCNSANNMWQLWIWMR